jgi:methyl acetate hydrolase
MASVTAGPGAAVKLERIFREAVDRGELPGIAATAANSQGITFAAAAGESRPGCPWAMDTVSWIASMTKAIVAVAALRLVEQGALKLDAPLGRLLPQLEHPVVLEGFERDGTPSTRPARTEITLRRLMSHTAGNAYHFWNANTLRYQQMRGIPPIGECRELTLTTPLVFDPGTAWEYGTNFEWVGKAIERAAGATLEQYLRQAVLDPLSLSDTSFVVTPERRHRVAHLYRRTPDGLRASEFIVPQQPEFLMGGGGMYTTPADYLTFLRMLLAGGSLHGEQILQPETIYAARANQIGPLEVGPFVTYEAASSRDVDFLPGAPKKWSLLGMLNVEATTGGRSAGSLFWAGLTNCYYWLDWQRGETGVLMTQILPFGDPSVLSCFEQFENGVREL